MKWAVYIIETSDNSYYTGITTDIQRRFNEHLTGKGAKFFNTCQPITVLYQESGHTRSSASKREAEIKSMTHLEKKKLIASKSK
ncbi:MAG: GIY-YIG nuclease family protein [Pseudomonadota bacterium]